MKVNIQIDASDLKDAMEIAGKYKGGLHSVKEEEPGGPVITLRADGNYAMNVIWYLGFKKIRISVISTSF